jgi:hypothetical protein
MFRIRFEIDEDARFEECNGESRPLTELEYAENQYMKDGEPIPYDEYLRYYGNPERHVYLLAIVQQQCTCCGHYSTKASLGNIDFMDDNEEIRAVTLDKWLDEATARALPGYLAEVVAELIDEAKGESQ